MRQKQTNETKAIERNKVKTKTRVKQSNEQNQTKKQIQVVHPLRKLRKIINTLHEKLAPNKDTGDLFESLK